MTQNIGEGRHVSFCTSCSQADDHPKHRIALTENALGKHLDCCSSDGCPDGSCTVILSDAKPRAGKGMLDHIVKVHEQRDVAAAVAEHQERNPELRQFHVAGQQPVALTQVNGEAR